MTDAARAVLWDLDGTLIDSAEYHWLAWREILAGEGLDLTRERFANSFGQRNDAVLRAHFGAEFPTSEIERIGDAKEARYRELIRAGGIELLPGVRRWLQVLAQAGWRQAVASSAPRLNIDAILAALDIEPLFTAVVAAEDVRHGKPNPEVFLVAAARVEVPPARCIVVEDAPAGVAAARSAGMRSIGVGEHHASLQADYVLRSLEDLPAGTFERLLSD